MDVSEDLALAFTYAAQAVDTARKVGRREGQQDSSQWSTEIAALKQMNARQFDIITKMEATNVALAEENRQLKAELVKPQRWLITRPTQVLCQHEIVPITSITYIPQGVMISIPR
jgi:hypothetical protein